MLALYSPHSFALYVLPSLMLTNGDGDDGAPLPGGQQGPRSNGT